MDAEPRGILYLQPFLRSQINVNKAGAFAPASFLFCRIQHVLDKNPVPAGWVIHQYMRHRTNQFSVLNDGTAAHALHDATGGI